MDGVAHEAAVDVIEFFMVGPFLFDIVDFEAYIGRDPEWATVLAPMRRV